MNSDTKLQSNTRNTHCCLGHGECSAIVESNKSENSKKEQNLSAALPKAACRLGLFPKVAREAKANPPLEKVEKSKKSKSPAKSREAKATPFEKSSLVAFSSGCLPLEQWLTPTQKTHACTKSRSHIDTPQKESLEYPNKSWKIGLSLSRS